ncbi:MAG: N-acyl homoserine lactonase family protein [Dokdonella sp.]
MKTRNMSLLTSVLFMLPMSMATAAATATPATVQLWRLDCGTIQVADLDVFSDTRAYVGRRKQLVASCYLIRHGDDYMLWDTGLSKADLNKPKSKGDAESESLKLSIVDQLAKIDVTPKQIGTIGISHYHFDHTGQAADFPQAKLLIGKGDLDAMRSAGDSGIDKPVAHWLTGGGAVDGVSGDRDVFGDGSVVMLDMSGHTPGHHGLLVQLKNKGPVLLSGDVVHFRENLESDGVPSFNIDRSRSLSSMDRYRKLARNLKATDIIQHEPDDVKKLPAFPASAD